MRAERPAPRHARRTCAWAAFFFCKGAVKRDGLGLSVPGSVPVFFAAGLLLAGAYCAGHIKPYAFSALRALHRWEPYLAQPRSRARAVLHLRAAGGMTGQTKRQGPAPEPGPSCFFHELTSAPPICYNVQMERRSIFYEEEMI